MVKAIAGSIVVVLLVGSSAFALGDIFQGFNFEADLIGSISLPAGPGTGSLAQNLLVGNDQAATGVGTAASQGIFGMLNQVGFADGMCAGLTVDQVLMAGSIDAAVPFGGTSASGQVQSITGCLGQVGQGQGVAVIGTQSLAKELGPGQAGASNSVLLNQDQAADNVMGAVAEDSCLAVMQNSSLGGGPGSVGSVMTAMSAGTAQVQRVEQVAQ